MRHSIHHEAVSGARRQTATLPVGHGYSREATEFTKALAALRRSNHGQGRPRAGRDTSRLCPAAKSKRFSIFNGRSQSLALLVLPRLEKLNWALTSLRQGDRVAQEAEPG